METMPGPNRKCQAQWNNSKAINAKREHLFLCKKQDVFLCQKREDVSPHPKGEEVFLCNKKKEEDLVLHQKEEDVFLCNKERRRDHLPKGRDVFICKIQDKRCSSAQKQKMCPRAKEKRRCVHL
jgi:hypothetical protein